MAEKRWIAETLFDDLGFRMTIRSIRCSTNCKPSHQHLVLFEQPFFGKMLMLDGATQISKKDEFIYQEMMSHVPLFAHGNARDVLIVGGGDCGIAEEVLKHRTVKRLTQVEIDAKVIEFAKEHFPEFTGPVFADKRFESRDRRRRKICRQDRPPLRRHHRRFNRSAGPGKNPVRREVLFKLQALFEKGRRAGDAKRRTVFPEERADRRRYRSSGACSRTPHAMSRRSRSMSAAIWPWVLPPTTNDCGSIWQKRSPNATARPAAFRPNTGRPNTTSQRLRSRALLPSWWRRREKQGDRRPEGSQFHSPCAPIAPLKQS